MSACSFLMNSSWLRWLGRIFGCKDEAPSPAPTPGPVDQVWTASFGALSVSISKRYAGAIFSLVWNGVEFVDDTDHGRQIQTAFQLDGGGEGNNPTEAGAAADASGMTSTAQLLGVNAAGNIIEASTRMADWIPFGDALSGYTLSKRITVGWNNMPNVIRDDITIESSENHGSVAIEGLTGYLLLQFGNLYSCDTKTGELKLLPYTASTVFNPAVFINSPEPLIFSNANGIAMGIFCPAIPMHTAWMGAGGNSNKWDMGLQSIAPFPAGRYSWTVYLVVGRLDDVRRILTELDGIV